MARLSSLVPTPLFPLYTRFRNIVRSGENVRCDSPLENPSAIMHSMTPPIVVERGASFAVKFHVKNSSVSTWSGEGRCPVQFRCQWRTSRKQATEQRDAIVPLAGVVRPGEAIEASAKLTAPDAVGQYLLDVHPEQAGGMTFRVPKPAWIDVQVVAPAVEEIDYHKVYATADLEQDYWTVVGPPTREEFHRLSIVKRGQLVEQGLTPDSHILDVGCGTGQLAAGLIDYLSPRGFYFGTDVGPEAIEFCRNKYPRPNFRFAVNDFTKLPIEHHRFDMACFFSVFTHTYPDETALLLAEAAKSLKPGGTILGDVFTSPLTDRCAGNRGAVELNREHFLRLVGLAGLQATVVSSWAWKDHARREVMRFALQ